MYSWFRGSRKFVLDKIPSNISGIGEIAYNLWFSWERLGRDLFFQINPSLWENVQHNPVKFLKKVKPEDLEKASKDPFYLQLYQKVMNKFEDYMKNTPENSSPVAYFSAEFGLHESLPIYSGGLGILAGDHLKAASDLGLSLVGMGLLYRYGYFTQRINGDGEQEAEYGYLHFHELPVIPVLNERGEEIIITVDLPDRIVYVKIWKVNVGRISLYLLDTDTGRNCRADRDITAQLYGGNRDTRIAQEIVLGIGGVKAFRALKINPAFWHINEGHSAFLCLERMREKIEGEGLCFKDAILNIRANTLFTTHTPVPAGHDVYSGEMIDYYFKNFYRGLKLSKEEFLKLGWDREQQKFNMTVLAFGFAHEVNGVSKLHGLVSQKMFGHFGRAEQDKVNIFHITNGVHVQSMMAEEIKILLDQYLSLEWRKAISLESSWLGVENIPEDILWLVHNNLKERMIYFIRWRIQMQRLRNYESAEKVAEVENFLEPRALTIGFARRFATYKRGLLIFRDLERLSKLISSEDRPLQIIFAGKAHPADHPGQKLIKDIINLADTLPFKGKVVFLENYDIKVARHLVQGVDIWLNTPRRPQEASGTSGMKASVNGVLHCSVLDGWWPEAYDGQNGFVIGQDKDYSSEEEQDKEDSQSLYQLLEEKIIPWYFDRNEAGVPHKWVEFMKNSIKTISPKFSAERMVKEYSFYYNEGIKRKNQMKMGK